ncbi:MAG: 16S rRNA (cytosine(967)-C(5))-methyltransferase RsmB [Candidatus Humimicrobiaceae bacterium]
MTGLDKARNVAFDILKGYFASNKLLKDLLDREFSSHTLSSLDKRFTYTLVKGVVRQLYYLDFAISVFSNKRLKNIDRDLLTILRMALYQILFMDKVPMYSAINESVELVKKRIAVGPSKFVNAILRKISSTKNFRDYLNNSIEKNTVSFKKKIGIMYSFPEWILAYWLESYSRKTVVKICKSLNEKPLYCIRFDPERIEKAELIKKLGLKEEAIKNQELPGSLSRSNIQVANLSGVTGSPFFRQGLFYIQDIASQIAVEYFARPRAGEKILDLCAAPGGKTILMAQLASSADILAVDKNTNRLQKIEENLTRLNIKNVKVVQGDATNLDLGNQLFDKIFIDAPCSAFGTISKNPDVKYNKKGEDLKRLQANSLKILDNAKKYLLPGGRIIFYTCTLSRIENQQTVRQFIEGNRGRYKIEPCKYLPGPKKDDGWLEIMPYFFNSEAGFVCSLVKLA